MEEPKKEGQKDTDLLGSELRRKVSLLILSKPELAARKGWVSKKAFVRQAVSSELAKYE